MTKLFGCWEKRNSFNSTRCIRNYAFFFSILLYSFLSTPHGALGTSVVYAPAPALPDLKPFNSTRCIRNHPIGLSLSDCFLTFNSTRCIRNDCIHGRSRCTTGLSTPHGALGTWCVGNIKKVGIPEGLSTPHGALGTTGTSHTHGLPAIAFNSTRCIRNQLWRS